MLAGLARACPGVARVRATAEETGLAGGSFDAITCAQTWHWVDVPAASAEFARLLRPGGVVYLEAARAWSDEELAPFGLSVYRHLKAGVVHAHLLRAAGGA